MVQRLELSYRAGLDIYLSHSSLGGPVRLSTDDEHESAIVIDNGCLSRPWIMYILVLVPVEATSPVEQAIIDVIVLLVGGKEPNLVVVVLDDACCEGEELDVDRRFMASNMAFLGVNCEQIVVSNRVVLVLF